MNNEIVDYVPNKKVYYVPDITAIILDTDIITESTAYDPNQGEWDVE